MVFETEIYPFNNSVAMKKYSAIIALCKKDCDSNTLFRWICMSIVKVSSS